MSFKCHLCPICNGFGCIGELPGMGGFKNSINFQNNCKGWNIVAKKMNFPISTLEDYEKGFNPKVYPVRLGPMTGGVENVGYNDEQKFYTDLLSFADKLGYKLSIGDGCPDCKLLYGIQTLKDINKKAAVFIKPYENKKIFERMEWAGSVSSHIGIDIDSYNIVTMRNQVKLEKKNSLQLAQLKKNSKVPFVIKGIFTKEDIELVKEVKPDVAFISNHGGRVENRIGSTAEFLAEFANELKNFCDEIWVDGGIRTEKDINTALLLGANQVIVGRPLISELSRNLIF
ncbi:MAG: alpha-hydroxy-acid oxidizing protein [Treponemataceae bacterium]